MKQFLKAFFVVVLILGLSTFMPVSQLPMQSSTARQEERAAETSKPPQASEDYQQARTSEAKQQAPAFSFLQQAQASESQDQLVQIPFQDENLYTRICKELEGKAVTEGMPGKTIGITRANLDSITKLSIRSGLVKDLSGIENFTALTELDISQNIIEKLSPLAALTNLRKLNAFDNFIDDLQGIGALTKLEVLKLGENNERAKWIITHLEELDSLVNLVEFDFSRNYTQDIVYHLANMSKLETLRLEWNWINLTGDATSVPDLDKITELKTLKSLNLCGAYVRNFDKLATLPNLEELNVARGYLTYIGAMVKSDGTPAWPNLRKLDISDNRYDSYFEKHPAAINYIKEKSLAGELELNGRNFFAEGKQLPHVDASGVEYVTYDDFGARCDGEYDDFIAMKYAHKFANEHGCEVRATPGKTYHIFKYYDDPAKVATNVDWGNATFVVHDEYVDERYGKTKSLLQFDNSADVISLSSSSEDADVVARMKAFNDAERIGTSTKRITSLEGMLAPLNQKGYKQYWVTLINKNKKQYIRSGPDANSGSEQQDRFLVDSQGNVLNDIQWDFDTVTSITVVPIAKKAMTVKNGRFVHNVLAMKRATTSREGAKWKPLYFYRNLHFDNATNVQVSNIVHDLDEDLPGASYQGFIDLYSGANITIDNCVFFPRKGSGSTYDLSMSRGVNYLVRNSRQAIPIDEKRWGVTCTNFLKDITYEGCSFNCLDSHQGNYNLTVRNCTLGTDAICQCGQGLLDVSNTTFTCGNMVDLRSDYGSTWKGTARFTDCTYKYWGADIPKIFKVKLIWDGSGASKKLHEYGYDLRVPDIYVDNLTIDITGSAYDKFYAISNTPGMTGNFPTGVTAYWSKNVYLNRVNIVKDGEDSGTVRLTYQKIDKAEGVAYNYAATDCTLRLANGTDVTRKVYESSEGAIGLVSGSNGSSGSDGSSNSSYKPGKGFITNQAVGLVLNETASATNTFSVYKDGAALETDKSVSGTVSRTFADDGEYRIEIDSTDRFLNGDNVGKVAYCFTVDHTYVDPVQAEGNAVVEKPTASVEKKAAQKITVTGLNALNRCKASKKTGKLAKKATFALAKKVKASGKGKLSYKLSTCLGTGKITKAKVARFVSINKKNGRITIKAKAPKGTYRFKVRIVIGADTGFKQAVYTTKVITIKVV